MSEVSSQDAERTILVIDDDITALDIVSFLFEDRGYQVKRCSGGKQALEMFDEIQPEVVLVDLMMPGINGVETVRQIRATGYDAPIIAFTATEDETIHQEAEDAGCDKVLLKPLRSSRLLAEIEELLAN